MEELLQELKIKISKYQDIYNRNEAAVRRQLIEPLLDCLGWRTYDPDFVEINSQTDEGDIPDYRLIRQKRTETYVEAKKLSANIQDHISQLARYCTHQGVEYGILTNGCDWLLIKTFEKDTKLRDRIIWQISLEKTDASIIQSKLEIISYEKIAKLTELIEKAKHHETFWVDLIHEPENELIDKLASVISKNFLEKYPDEDSDTETTNTFFKLKLRAIFEESVEHPGVENNIDDPDRPPPGRKTESAKKTKKTRLRVQFNNGKVIEEHLAADTFTSTIKEIGLSKVESLRLTVRGIPLVGTKRSPKYKQRQINDKYVCVHSSTEEKRKMLETIAKCLGVRLKVDII